MKTELNDALQGTTKGLVLCAGLNVVSIVLNVKGWSGAFEGISDIGVHKIVSSSSSAVLLSTDERYGVDLIPRSLGAFYWLDERRDDNRGGSLLSLKPHVRILEQRY